MRTPPRNWGDALGAPVDARGSGPRLRGVAGAILARSPNSATDASAAGRGTSGPMAVSAGTAAREDAWLDEALAATFPASDPLARRDFR